MKTDHTTALDVLYFIVTADTMLLGSLVDLCFYFLIFEPLYRFLSCCAIDFYFCQAYNFILFMLSLLTKFFIDFVYKKVFFQFSLSHLAIASHLSFFRFNKP